MTVSTPARRPMASFLDFPTDALDSPKMANAMNFAPDRPYRISEVQMQALLAATSYAIELAVTGSTPFDLASALYRLDTSLRLSPTLPRVFYPKAGENAPELNARRHASDGGSKTSVQVTSDSSMVGCTPMVDGGVIPATGSPPNRSGALRDDRLNPRPAPDSAPEQGATAQSRALVEAMKVPPPPPKEPLADVPQPKEESA